MSKYKSTYVNLDIISHRHHLEKRLLKGEKVVFNIRVELDTDSRAWNDDGTSIAFGCNVLNLEEVK